MLKIFVFVKAEITQLRVSLELLVVLYKLTFWFINLESIRIEKVVKVPPFLAKYFM